MPTEISLVMPVWQPRSDWLHEAVRSALDQTGVDLELVVVDDGNDEPVADVLADVHDPRLRHVRIEHGGVSAARNAGIAHLKGAFVRFIDADDVIEPGSTARLRALATPTTIAYEDTVVCDDQLRPAYTISSRLSGCIAVECLMGRFDSRHVSMLFPVDVVRSAGPWDTRLRVRQDFDFVLRCLEHASVVPGEGTATFYRRHDASATRSPHAIEDAQLSSRLVLTGFFARHPEHCGTAVERDAWHRIHSAEARTALDRGRPAAAVRFATPLLRLAPREGVGLYVRAAQKAARLSGAAIARTTRRARAALKRRAG